MKRFTLLMAGLLAVILLGSWPALAGSPSEEALNLQAQIDSLKQRVDRLSRSESSTILWDAATGQTVTTSQTDFINSEVTVPGWASSAEVLAIADLGASETVSNQNYEVQVDVASGGLGAYEEGSSQTIPNGTTATVATRRRALFGPSDSADAALASTITIDVSAETNDHDSSGCVLRLWVLVIFRGAA